MSATTRLLTWFGRLSNTAHPYSKSISIIKMYSQISYPIWQMSILMFAWWVSDNQVLLRSDAFLNSYGGRHAITLQWCFHSNKMSIISHSYVSAFWLQSHILRCGLDGTPMFWNAKSAGKDNVTCCAGVRFPDGALGKIIAARKHRTLAGCKREGAVCICKTIIFWLSRS